MPEHPDPKPRPHPWRTKEFSCEAARREEAERTNLVRLTGHPPSIPASDGYAELAATSNYTFLTGASHPEELVQQAAALGYRALAITDVNTLAGIVRGHVAAKEVGLPFIVGSHLRITMPEEMNTTTLELLVYPVVRAGYTDLCRLLTLGKRRSKKGECELTLHDVLPQTAHWLAIILPPSSLVIDDAYLHILTALRQTFDGDRLSLGASCTFTGEGGDRQRLRLLAALSEHTGIPLVALNDVLYHEPARKPLQDVLNCIRHGCTLDEAGYRLQANAERYLKPPSEMLRLFAQYPQTIERTLHIAQRAAGFSLDELRYEYPEEVCPAGRSADEHLADLAWSGAQSRYPDGVPPAVSKQVEHELALIAELRYAPYFLTVHDLVVYARSRDILCQGRGAAANSAVCYCLGVTSVDPNRINLLFERFISKERNEPPDIDIDFEHERREEVIQYIYAKYGRERAALTAEVITYRGKSAVRDVGKALGLSLDTLDRLSGSLDWWDADGLRPQRMRELGLNPTDPTLHRLHLLAKEIIGFPRHLSQHVGGFVITRGPLCELVPIENAAMPDRTVIEWDKDDIDAMGMLKVDCLGLGMLTCVRKCFDLVRAHHGRDCTLANIPHDDVTVYDMCCRADTLGVFQIESRAQMAMLPRLRPRTFYDLVIEVAIVRPGPIQGRMVHPYLKRRTGEETVSYATPELERVLGRTLGVPLFQEQAMALAIVAAGFTPGEADQLRRAMAAWKRKGDKLLGFRQRLTEGMLANGYSAEYAERCFEQIKGFGEYGFPESHAASFALIVYVSAWLKLHYPAAFASALINSQPMGFYAPAQIIRDAQEHGVEVRPIDVNHSAWDCTLEVGAPAERGEDREGVALRIGMRLVRGMRQEDAEAIRATILRNGPYSDMDLLRWESGVSVTALRRLAAADGFGSMGLDRQAALWQARRLSDETLPLFASIRQQTRSEKVGRNVTGGVIHAYERVPLPMIPEPRKVVQDYEAVGLSLKAHPVSFIRPLLDQRSVVCASELASEPLCPHGRKLLVAGLVLVRQRPSTANGILFITLEDETGIANLIVRPRVYERQRRIARHSPAILVHGSVERQGEVVHVMAHRFEDISGELTDLTVQRREFH